MFGGLVAAQTLGGDFKLAGAIAKGRRKLAQNEDVVELADEHTQSS